MGGSVRPLIRPSVFPIGRQSFLRLLRLKTYDKNENGRFEYDYEGLKLQKAGDRIHYAPRTAPHGAARFGLFSFFRISRSFIFPANDGIIIFLPSMTVERTFDK